MAAALLGWSPEIFWSATPVEFFTALEERQLLAGGGEDDDAEDFLKFKEAVENGDRRRNALAD